MGVVFLVVLLPQVALDYGRGKRKDLSHGVFSVAPKESSRATPTGVHHSDHPPAAPAGERWLSAQSAFLFLHPADAIFVFCSLLVLCAGHT